MRNIDEWSGGPGARGLRWAASAIRTILIVGCNDDDARSIREMLLRLNVGNPIEILPGAAELLRYLKPDGDGMRPANTSPTALILLDLNARHESGFASLRWLHEHFGGRGIPLAIMTNIHDLNQLRRAYQLGAWTFLRKPLGRTEFTAMTEAFQIPIFYSSMSELGLWPLPLNQFSDSTRR